MRDPVRGMGAALLLLAASGVVGIALGDAATAARSFQRALERLARTVEGASATSVRGWQEREADHE